MGKNTEALDKLNQEYSTLSGLNTQNPHPGDDKTDNIKAAKEQNTEVRAFITGKVANVFKPIPPIPDSTNVDNSMLATAIRRTIDQMRKDAAARGVQLATNYYFSFTVEGNRIMFDKAGLLPLSIQLGEVKAICDVLFTARVNAIDSIRREKVSVHDVEAQQSTDYLERNTVTNDVAMISPYEISLRCFSSEIAALLSGFANSPNGLIVRAINVEPATATGADTAGIYSGTIMPGYTAPPGVQRPFGEGYPPPVPTPTPTPQQKGGLPTLLDEKQLKVTLLIEVVKLTAKK
jgi:hypothetical protein